MTRVGQCRNQSDQAYDRVSGQLEEATDQLNAAVLENEQLAEESSHLQQLLKAKEAEYAHRFQEFRLKTELISSKYKKVEKKLLEISDKCRTQSMLISNNEALPVEDRILQIFKGNRESMNEFMLSYCSKISPKE